MGDPSTAASPAKPLRTAAQRASQFSINLLVSGLVVMIVLFMGRHLFVWPTGAPTPISIDPEMSSAWTAEFASGLTWTREEIVGDKASAQTALTAACQRLLASAAAPTEPINAPESQLLTALRSQVPIATLEGQWRIYQHERSSMMVGILTDSAGHDRLSCWGLLQPTGPNRWQILALPLHGSKTTSSLTIDLPESAAPTLTLSAADGSKSIGFRFATPMDAVVAHFERRLGPQISLDKTSTQQWFVRYDGGTELSLSIDDAGQGLGMLLLKAAKRRSATNEGPE